MSRVFIAVTAAGVLLTACGTDHADIPRVERQIATGIKEQTDSAVRVDCPREVEWRTGGEFHCIVRDQRGRTLTRVTVSMENDSGDMTWETG